MAYQSTILEDIGNRGREQRGKTPQDATDFIYMSVEDIFDTPFAEVEKIQLETLKARFETLVEKVVPLRQLADRQGIKKIETFADAAPLLFTPKVLKSYPLSLLENNEFGKLTLWLDRLTTHDLSGVDVSACDTIDGWLDQLEAHTPMMIMHSSGTTGKLSIMPRSRVEICHLAELLFKYFTGYKDGYGSEIRDLGGTVPIFMPTYRHGRHIQRMLWPVYEAICGTEEDLISAYPGRLSADLLTLGGRLAAAEAKGEAGRIALNPALLAQRDSMIEFQKHQGDYMDAYFAKMREYQGRQVLVAGTWTVHLQAALQGEERNLQGLFSPKSFPLAGGGKKGQNFPDDWYERICRFYGMPEMRTNYGMTEITGLMQQCSQGNYHPWPHQIIYLLDTATGAALPRTGIQRGRFGFVDLAAETYWGGGWAGDEVTVDWNSGACACHRQGPHVRPDIVRLSEQQGGDDKISCAGAQAAHDAALDFLAKL
jgi:hypothetical protein